MTISSHHVPALESNDLMFGRCLSFSSHENPPKLEIHQKFGNMWGNRGRELEEGGEKLSCLSIAEYCPRVGSSPFCCHGVCDFGEAAGNSLLRNSGFGIVYVFGDPESSFAGLVGFSGTYRLSVCLYMKMHIYI